MITDVRSTAAKLGTVAAIFISASGGAFAQSASLQPQDYVASYGDNAPYSHNAWISSAGSIYQNPDGTYESHTDFSRDLDGIPCGIECTREARARVKKYYIERSGTRGHVGSRANSAQPEGPQPSSY